MIGTFFGSFQKRFSRAMANTMKTPVIPGSAFAEILEELHAHAFEGSPGESDPFVLTFLEREYIAYVLALYY